MNGARVVVEAWMAQRLGLPMNWDAGVTTREDRREKIRAAILEKGLAFGIAGKRPGKPAETWQQLFLRVYGHSLNESPKEQSST